MMGVSIHIDASTPEELRNWVETLSALAPGAVSVADHGKATPAPTNVTTDTAAASVGSAPAEENPETDDKPKALRGENAKNEAERIITAINAVETMGGLSDVKADNLDTIDALPKKRQEEVQKAIDAKIEALHVPEDTAQAEPEPETAETATTADPLAGLFPCAEGSGDPDPNEGPEVEAPVPGNSNIPAEPTVEDLENAVQFCFDTHGFPEAAKRMQGLGYSRVTEVPADAAKRREFIAKLRAEAA